MLRAEKQLEQEINALMRKAEILDAQENRCSSTKGPCPPSPPFVSCPSLAKDRS